MVCEGSKATVLAVFVCLLLSCAHSTADFAAMATSEESVMTFTTEGSAFAPVLVAKGRPDILWTWSDGTTSTSPRPTKEFGTPGTRTHVLRVKPWDAIQRINIGYDGADGGDPNIETVSDQNVSKVTGLSLVAPSLQQWCSSYNQLTSLELRDFVSLETIESYLSRDLVHLDLANTPKLKRVCFEDNNLAALDVSQSPHLEDIRAASNNFSAVAFGGTTEQVWHICLRDNPQITNQALFSDLGGFPNLSELFIWNTNQAGRLRVVSTNATLPVAILAHRNQYSTLDLSGSLRNESAPAMVNLGNNRLTQVDIAGCVQITELYLANNHLDTTQVDAILMTLDKLGRSRLNTGSSDPLGVSLQGNNPPSGAGLAAAQRLMTKGWKVEIGSQDEGRQ